MMRVEKAKGSTNSFKVLPRLSLCTSCGEDLNPSSFLAQEALLAPRSQLRVRSALPSERPPGQALSAHLRREAPPGPGFCLGLVKGSRQPAVCLFCASTWVQPSPAEAPQVEGKGQSWGQPEGGVNCHRALVVKSAGPALVRRCGQTAYLQVCQNLQQPKREPRIFGHTY